MSKSNKKINNTNQIIMYYHFDMHITCPQVVAQSVVNYVLWSGGHKFKSSLPLPLRRHVKKKKNAYNIILYVIVELDELNDRM